MLISDFDGTVARLPVDWAALRAYYGVRSILDLWMDSALDWSTVTEAEVSAARTAQVLPGAERLLADDGPAAVLTNNSELAVGEFLDHHPELGERIAVVVGRETLEGPKNDFECFREGILLCMDALGSPQVGIGLRYLGDQDYELEFARRLGLDAVDARSLRDSAAGTDAV